MITYFVSFCTANSVSKAKRNYSLENWSIFVFSFMGTSVRVILKTSVVLFNLTTAKRYRKLRVGPLSALKESTDICGVCRLRQIPPGLLPTEFLLESWLPFILKMAVKDLNIVISLGISRLLGLETSVVQ